MSAKTKYFGYDEEQIDDASTLSQLAESSGRLLKENRNFLREIYNNLDE